MTMTSESTLTARSRAIGRVAVGVDLSPAGLAALSWATEEAIASGARMTICHARDEGDPHGAAPDLETLRLAQPDLARRVRWCRQLLGGGNVDLELPLSDVTAALLDLSERADLLVVGGQSESSDRHRSRAGQIAAAARCPVVMVRPSHGHASAPFAGHVVIGIDQPAGSPAAIQLGFSHAARHHLPVAAVHVDGHWPGDYWFDDRFLETHFAAEPAALDLLARALEPVARHYPQVAVKRAVFGGDLVTGLRHAATGAILLALGRHRQRLSAVHRAFMDHAECTVAIVPSGLSALDESPSQRYACFDANLGR